jgi:hypothetical protein
LILPREYNYHVETVNMFFVFTDRKIVRTIRPMKTPSQKIIDLFPSRAELSRMLDLKWPSLVTEWYRRGQIPVKHIPAVIQAGRRVGLELDYADFFEERE